MDATLTELIFKIYSQCCRPINTAHNICLSYPSSRIPNRRSHTLPIQRIHVRNPIAIDSLGSKRKLTSSTLVCSRALDSSIGIKGDLLGCGFFFAVLLNFKHIYMYQAVGALFPCFLPSAYLESACILHISSPSVLHVPSR